MSSQRVAVVKTESRERYAIRGNRRGGSLVAQRGEVVFEQAYGLADADADTPNTTETVFDSGSLSKQVTAAAVLALEEAGELRVDDPLSRSGASSRPSRRAKTGAPIQGRSERPRWAQSHGGGKHHSPSGSSGRYLGQMSTTSPSTEAARSSQVS